MYERCGERRSRSTRSSWPYATACALCRARADIPSLQRPRPPAASHRLTEASDDHDLRGPAQRRRRDRRPRHPRAGVRRRRVRRRDLRRDVRLREPDLRRGRRPRGGLRRGGRRPRRRRCPGRVRVRRLVAPRAEEAQARAAEACRAHVRARRGARSARDGRHGQADPGCDECRRAARDRVHRVVRRGDRQGLRRDRPHGARRARLDRARAARRRRRGGAVELPADDGVVEARPGARDRQQRRAEARRAVAAHRAPARRAGLGGGDPRGGAPGRPRLRRDRRPGARPSPGRRHDRVHRLDGGRQVLPALLGRVEHEAAWRSSAAASRRTS